jgi:hypothetical protein
VHALGRAYGGYGGQGASATGSVAATSTTTGTQNAKAFLYLGAGNSSIGSALNVGLQGGVVTSGAATATEATATGGTANAQVKATGGAGGTASTTNPGSITTGGAGGTVSNLSASAYGFNARATVVGTGGDGVGGYIAIGGAGGSVTLSNAVSGKSRGGYITLSQAAIGGAGGYGNAGDGGAGGGASSSLSFSDAVNAIAASSLTTSTSAVGGAGGGSSYSSAAAGGAGGAASASNRSRSSNGGYAQASATGGSGGTGASAGAGGNAQATVVNTATGLGAAALARATASATGGSGATQGIATASATATTANGQESQATATGDGSTDNFTATASTAGSGVLLGLTDTAHVTGGGKLTSVADAIINGSTPGFAGSSDNAYADVDGDPTSAEVNSLVAGASKVAAVLGTSTTAVDVADGKQGAYASLASGTHSYTSSETFHLDATGLSGDLVLGLLGPQAIGTGLTDAKLTVTVGGGAAQVFNETSLAAANTFFSDDALNLGTFSAAANLAVTVSLSETFSGTGSGYAIDYLLGATSSSLSLAVPEAQVLGVSKARSITGVSLSASDTVADEIFTARLADTHGDLTVTANGAKLSGDGTKSLTITGSLSAVDAALATLSDTDATVGTDTIRVSASDSLGSSAPERSFRVTANGLPALGVPRAQTLSSGVATPIKGVSLTESGKTGAPERFTAKLADTHGQLSVTANGAKLSGNGTKSLTITGSLSEVDAALASLTDTDATSGNDKITLNASDSFGNAAASAAIAVTVKASGAISHIGAMLDRADHRADPLAATLQRLDQYATQFGVTASDYSSAFDQGLRMPAHEFSLEHTGNLEARHWKSS